MSQLLNNDLQSPARGARWHYLLVAAVGAIIVFWRLGAAAMDDHECFLALTARSMADPTDRSWLVESDLPYAIPPRTAVNRWLVPVENGRPRLVKTPLPYWTAAAAGIAFGGVDNWTARLPSALCAVLLTLVTLAVGRRMLTPRAALFGALMLAAASGFQKWGRDARPEMMLCLLVTSAMGLFYVAEQARGRRHVAWMAAFWITMGLANLAKEFVPCLLAWPLAIYVFWRQSDPEGHDEDPSTLRALRIFLIASGAGLLVHVAVTSLAPLRWWAHTSLSDNAGVYLTLAAALGLPMLWYLRRTSGWRAIVRLLPTAVPGVLVMLACFIPWMKYMEHLFPGVAGHVFSEQVTDRAAGSGDWSVAEPYVYLYALPGLALPWIAFVPGGLAVGLMRRFASHRRPLVYLLLWVVGLFALFTASAVKRDHYILPALPALCLLMGFAADDVIRGHRWITERLARTLGLVHALAAVLLAAGAAVAAWAAIRHQTAQAPMWPWELPVVVAGAIPLAIGGLLAWRRGLGALIPFVAAAGAVLYVGHWTFIDRWDDRGPAVQFAREAAALINDPDAKVLHWGDPQAKTVFYFGRTIPSIHWPVRRRFPDANEIDLGRLTLEEVAQHPPEARWIFGYEPPPKVLIREGFLPVLRRPDGQKKSLVFSLLERESPAPATQPASASNPAREPQSAPDPNGSALWGTGIDPNQLARLRIGMTIDQVEEALQPAAPMDMGDASVLVYLMSDDVYEIGFFDPDSDSLAPQAGLVFVTHHHRVPGAPRRYLLPENRRGQVFVLTP